MADTLTEVQIQNLDESVQVAAQPSEEEELKRSDIIELGDYLKIYTGPVEQGQSAVAGEGYVYYRDSQFIKYLNGDTVVTLPLDESGNISTELGVQRVQFKKAEWRANESDFELTAEDSFLNIFGFKEGDIVQSYKNGKGGPFYSIISVNYNDDIGILQQVDTFGKPLEEPREVPFEFTGIPIGKGFDYDVIKKIQLDRPLVEGSESNTTSANTETFEEISEPIINHLGEIPPPTKINKVLVQLEEREIVYDADDQRQEMMRDLLSLESPERQKKETVLIDLRRFVDLLLEMKNTIVTYDHIGQPDKNAKITSASFLSDLINAPLVMPVIDSIKHIYVDEKESGTREEGLIDVKNLADIVKSSIEFLKKVEARSSEEGQASWMNTWQEYVNLYMRSWYSNSAKQKTFKRDLEYFRLCSPNNELEECGKCEDFIPGFRGNLPRFKKGSDKNQLLSSDRLDVINMSIGRGLAAQIGKPTTKEFETLLNAESAGINHYILFPYSVADSIGPVRSGKLVTDMIRSQKIPSSIYTILKQNGGVVVTPTADHIIALGGDNDSCENIQIETYLSTLPLWNVKGFDHFEDVFAALGLDQFEINKEQLTTISTRIKESLAFHLESLRTLNTIGRNQDKAPIIKRSFEESQDMQRLLFEPLSTLINRDSIKNFTRLPAKYRDIDFVRLNFLVQQNQDLVDAILGGNPITIAREGYRSVQDAYQITLREFTMDKLRETTKGKQPQPNECPHVDELDKIRRVRDKPDRMKLLFGFVMKNKGQETRDFPKTKQHKCRLCRKNLICDHEFKLIHEFLNPRDSRALHKDILLNFMGGEFQGQFICKYCGQSIQQVEYDTSMEFDDNGRPMMGRAVLDDPDDRKTALINELIGPSLGVEEEDVEFEIDTEVSAYKKFKEGNMIGIQETVTGKVVAKKIYECAKKIYQTLGVNPPKASYDALVKSVNSYIIQLPDRDTYMRSRYEREGKKEEDPCSGGIAKAGGVARVDYYVYLNRRIILYTAAFIFIDIQTHRPSYIIQYDEKTSFEGYPFSENKEETDGLKYLSYSIAGIIRDEEPWNLTQWHLIDYLPKRREYIERCIMALFTEMRDTATVKAMIQDKKAYLESKAGRHLGEIEETIPSYFLPEQIAGGDKEGAAASAAHEGSALSLIRHINTEAATHNIYTKSPFSETSCCLADIRKPTYWQEKNLGGKGTTIPRGPRGARMAFPYVPRHLESIRLEVPAVLFPRVFLKVCFSGERVGLPHEPGFTRVCPHCKFEFPEEPADTPLPDVPMKSKDYAEWIAKRDEKINTTFETAVKTTLGVTGEISKDAFQNLLDTTHIRYRVELKKRTKQTIAETRTTFFRSIQKLVLYDTWKAEIKQVYELFGKLVPSPPEQEQRNTLAPLEKTHQVLRKIVEQRITPANLNILEELCKLSSIELKTQLQTYFIVPFNRGIQGADFEGLSFILNDYEPLSTDHKASIKTNILNKHFDYFIGSTNTKENKFHELFDKEKNSDLRKRAKDFVKQIQGICTLLSEFHLSAIGLTSERFRVALNRYMVIAAFANYVSLQGGIGQLDVKESITTIVRCINKYRTEAVKYTDEQVREGIAARNEIEKQSFIKKLSTLDKDKKRIELLKKRLGLGEWSVGGTKLIYAYDADYFDLEREKDAAAGIINWHKTDSLVDELPQGRQFDEAGFEVDAGDEAEGGGLDDRAGDYGGGRGLADDSENY